MRRCKETTLVGICRIFGKKCCIRTENELDFSHDCIPGKMKSKQTTHSRGTPRRFWGWDQEQAVQLRGEA